MSSNVFETVILSALLHDIGKALQKGTGAVHIKGKHPKISKDFICAFMDSFNDNIKKDLLEVLVEKHHESSLFPRELLVESAPEEYKHLCYLISSADNFSSSERGKPVEGSKNYRRAALGSVFSRLSLNNAPEMNSFYHLSALGPEVAFPLAGEVLEEGEVSNYLLKFGQELKKVIIETGKSQFEVLLCNLLSVFEQFLWCIPSNSQEEFPDVSLYDHLRTTAAIAACLYSYHDEKELWSVESIKNDQTKKFRLIVGDLSGIQSYIFDISHQGAGGVARRLRARSFYLSMLSEVVSHYILHQFELPVVNILMASGGKFFVLVPNTSTSEDKIYDIQNNLDKFSLEQFQGEISVNLASIPFNGKGFKNFSMVLEKAAEKLNQRKSAPLSSALIKNSEWQQELFQFPLENSQPGLCSSCRKRFASIWETEDLLCNHCAKQTQLGKELIKAEYIAFYRRHISGSYHIFGDYYIKLFSGSITVPEAPYLAIRLNSDYQPDSNVPVIRRFIANHVPIAKEDILVEERGEKFYISKGSSVSLDVVAESGQGKPYLAYLKADVDNLGQLFVFGLKDEKDSWDTVSRLATLSRMLDLFFSGWIEVTIRRKFPNCYVIFSGGDDLFIIGPWKEIIEFYQELNSAFKCYTCDNKDITLSCGIVMAKPKTPISSVTHWAEDRLEEAKETILPGQKYGRNQFSFLGTVAKSESIEAMVKDGEVVSRWLKEESISVGFVRKLQYFSRLYELYWKERNSFGLKFLPLLAYNIQRNISGQEEKKWFSQLLNLTNERLKYLNFIAVYALLSQGGE